MSKILRNILIVAVVIAVGIGLYLGWQAIKRGALKAKPSVPKQPAETEKIFPKILSENNVFDYWINKSSNEIYYISDDGQIYKITAAGKNQKVGSQTIGLLSYIKPSHDGTMVLVSFGYPQNPTFAIYNAMAKTWQALPEGTVAAAWDPKSSNRLVYLREIGAASRLYLLTLADQKPRELLQLTQKDLDLEWVLPDVIYFKERPTQQISASLWSYNLATKSIKTVVSKESGLSIRWAENGERGIKWNGGLSVIDANNANLATINLKTLPAKCIFAEIRIYCAAPRDQSLVGRTTFPDDYQKRSVLLNDDIFIIPLLESGRQAKLPVLRFFDSEFAGVNIDADRVETQNSQLLFINRHDKKLYSLSF